MDHTFLQTAIWLAAGVMLLLFLSRRHKRKTER